MGKNWRSQVLTAEQTLTQLNYDAYLVHRRWMKYTLELAKAAEEKGEIPVAAVIIDSAGNLLAEAINSKESNYDATAHAEILAIGKASQAKQNWCLQDCTLYVNLEPCAMCAGAIIQSRIGLLVYGASEPKTGAIRTVLNLPDSDCSNHRLRVIAGIQEESCRQQLQAWFSQQRKRNL